MNTSTQPQSPTPSPSRADRERGSPRDFTDYLRSLDETGAPPDPEAFERVWLALRRLLAHEIHKRGLWRAPPSYLGVFGWRSWDEQSGGDALDELVADCYAFVFVERLRILRSHLARKPAIEGLVVRSVRNFLYDVQKRRDPLGFRVFDLVKTALMRALDAAELWIVGGGRKIVGDIVVGCRPEADAAAADLLDPTDSVRAWNDDLLPGLVTARGKAKEALVEDLRSRLVALCGEGVEVFRAKEVIDALKADARARWAAVFEWGGDGLALEPDESDMIRLVHQIGPDTTFEDQERFDKLLACISEGLERLDLDRRTREHLWTLWTFLRTYAAEASAGSVRSASGSARGESGDRLPSQRELSQRLGIPRDRFTDLFATLRELLERCLTVLSENSKVICLDSRRKTEWSED